MKKSRSSNAAAAELDLLLVFVSGKQTFEQVKADAQSFLYADKKLKALVASNTARGISKRLEELTGIGKGSLFFHEVRCLSQ